MTLAQLEVDLGRKRASKGRIFRGVRIPKIFFNALHEQIMCAGDQVQSDTSRNHEIDLEGGCQKANIADFLSMWAMMQYVILPALLMVYTSLSLQAGYMGQN